MKASHTLLLASLFTGQALAVDRQVLPDTAPAPADSPTTEAKVELGKMLYMDPRFSSTGTVSMGVHGKTGGRNAPSVWNSAFHSVQFWDGRAALLEDQAKGPVANPVEMGMSDVEAAMERVKAIPGYRPYFAGIRCGCHDGYQCREGRGRV